MIGYKNGSFFLKNQGASHCAAIRIGTEPGLRDWPLELGATFSAGNSIFLVKEYVPCICLVWLDWREGWEAAAPSLCIHSYLA